MAAPAAAKPTTGNRKTFRRTKVSPLEHVASLIIVLLLVVIPFSLGMWVLPHTQAMDSQSLNSPAPGGSEEDRPARAPEACSGSPLRAA